MSDRIGLNNQFNRSYLIETATNNIHEIEARVKKYHRSTKLMLYIMVVINLISLLLLGYIFYRYNFLTIAITLTIVIIVGLVVYHLSGLIYSIKPFYSHLYKVENSKEI